MYKIVRHGPTCLSLVREMERMGAAGPKGVIRDRVLLMMVEGRAIVLKGSLIISEKEIIQAIGQAR